MHALRLVVLFLLALFLGCAPATHQSRTPSGDTGGRPAESMMELTDDGAWCWFAAPHAVSLPGEHERTFAGWVDSEGYVWVGSVDHSTGEIETTALKGFDKQDDHASPALLARPGGMLIVFYSAHSGDLMYYRVTANPEDVSRWGEQKTVGLGARGTGNGVTYPNPVALSAEGNRIYLFYRDSAMKPAFVTTDDLARWSAARRLVHVEGDNAYAKYDSDGVATIHFAFTNGHPRGRPENSIYYGRIVDGVVERADGSRICGLPDLPIEPSDADLVYDASRGAGRAWIWDVAADADGNPAVVYAVFPRESDHRYRYARWDGSRWSDHEMVAAGPWYPKTPPGKEEREVYYSGGIALDHDDPSNVYLSRRVRGVLEIEKWTTEDRGKTWRHSAVTAGSASDNARPVVPRGHASSGPSVIWMSGEYFHYTEYSTSLRMDLPSE